MAPFIARSFYTLYCWPFFSPVKAKRWQVVNWQSVKHDLSFPTNSCTKQDKYYVKLSSWFFFTRRLLLLIFFPNFYYFSTKYVFRIMLCSFQILAQISDSLWCLMTGFKIGLNEEIFYCYTLHNYVYRNESNLCWVFLVHLVFSALYYTERKVNGYTWTLNYLLPISKKQILWTPWKVCESLDFFLKLSGPTKDSLATKALYWTQTLHNGWKKFLKEPFLSLCV